MPSTPPAAQAEPLRLALHFELQLAPEGPQAVWQAELLDAGAGAALHFASLPELIRYLTRLDLQVPPPRGIR